ncbi:MAG: D-glycero-beta-D-manno-heptose 1-phosphate adenylyltransferase, partial [Pseudomonadota bacterium]
LVLSDYGKGLLTPHLIKRLIAIAKKHKVPSLVDPKHKDFTVYKGATFITPNKKELQEAAENMSVSTDADVENAAKFLIKKYGIENVIATRSEDGMSFIPKRGEALHSRTQTIAVYDVSGAGDTVVAVLAASIGAKGGIDNVLSLANKAGAIVVSKPGTAVVTQEELKENLSVSTQDKKLKPKEDAREQILKWQAEGLKVGFTNGCFDILHHGHVTYLEDAKKKCDRLVVGLNHDQSVRILKGPTRPVNDQEARASVLSALSSVDAVVFFGATKESQDNTPCDIIDFLKPDILMKGGDYTVDDLPEAKVVQSYGGQVEIMPLYEGYSTTNIINKAAAE